MDVAILSDIHGNIYALKEVIKECKESGVDRFLVLGDLVGYYYQPLGVMDALVFPNDCLSIFPEPDI